MQGHHKTTQFTGITTQHATTTCINTANKQHPKQSQPHLTTAHAQRNRNLRNAAATTKREGWVGKQRNEGARRKKGQQKGTRRTEHKLTSPLPNQATNHQLKLIVFAVSACWKYMRTLRQKERVTGHTPQKAAITATVSIHTLLETAFAVDLEHKLLL
jgi:hypothetical protein